MKKNKKPKKKIKDHEDAALKMAAQYFGDVMLPYFGIEGEVVSYGSTELVQAEVRKLYEDFNFIMKDGRWLHFEFQSTNEGKKGMRRFREYEASTSNHFQTEVITYVLFSGNIKKPMTELHDGINVYRIHPIIMKGHNCDKLIAKLQKKVEAKEPLTKEDLFPLLLCPLMSGCSSQKDRLSAAYQITRNASMVDEDDIKKLQAVMYIMADKFLKGNDLEKFKEEVKMTRLGQMIFEDGRKEGLEQGSIEKILILTQKKLSKGQTISQIADALEETVETIEALIKEHHLA